MYKKIFSFGFLLSLGQEDTAPDQAMTYPPYKYCGPLSLVDLNLAYRD